MIKNISYSNKIVLYWDLPEFYEQGSSFTVMLDGKPVGETDKFHFEVTDLAAERQYSFSVFMTNKIGNTNSVGKLICSTDILKARIDITKPPYNAKGDGKTLNTKCIQKAIDDCSLDECVYIPEGDFMTGALKLHSDMELYLAKGAVLHGTADVKDYEPKIKSRFEGIEMMCYSALINAGTLDRESAFNCNNVKIYGEGTICGGGRELAENVIDRETVLMKDYIDLLGDKINECECARTIPGRARPRLINVSCAENVVISGVNIMNGASWNVHMIYSDNVVTHDCTFRSQGVWNGDGWNPDSSTNCTIFGCEFFTGDDAVAIKSGKNPEGNIINRPCEHIRIFDCVNHCGHGITIGSEMSGGINDVHIWNCDMTIAARGIEIKATKKRGGYVRNVRVSYSSVCRVLMHSVGYNDDGEAAPAAPVFEDCLFENLQITAVMHEKDGRVEPCEAIHLSGFDETEHCINNVCFKNLTIDSGENKPHSICMQFCRGISFENINVNVK